MGKVSTQSIPLQTIVTKISGLATTLRAEGGSLAGMQVSADVAIYDFLKVIGVPESYIALVLGEEMEAVDKRA